MILLVLIENKFLNLLLSQNLLNISEKIRIPRIGPHILCRQTDPGNI
jgi:hypothetical protein